MKRLIASPLFILLFAGLLLAGCGTKPSADVGNPGQSKVEVATATPKPQVTEQFKSDEPVAWSDPLFIAGNPKLTDITAQSNSLTFTLKDLETYVYKFYDKDVYEDVNVTATVSNLGDNANGIALICRASDLGWYEFRAASGGTYEIFAYSQKLKDQGANPYKLLTSGGSGLIGARTNKLMFSCKGTALKIFSDDQEIKLSHGEIEDSTFTKGKVGVGVMSFQRVPVKISFENISIAKP